jgi:tRNA guanosine-2'-O-methyltransferase
MRQPVRAATSYLTLLKCSYWLPSDCNHVIDAGTLELLSRFVSLSATDELAYDAMSALFSLLRKDGPIVIAPTANDAETWLKLDPSTEQMVLSGSILDSSLWDQLSMINPRNPTTGELSTSNRICTYVPIVLVIERDTFQVVSVKSTTTLSNTKPGKQTSRVFRTWFQWISQAVNDKKRLDCLHDDRYWDILRFGMLYGHGDQRKYCIGIVRQSLLAAQSDIDTSVMQFRIAERTAYLRIYEQYSALFETIVLDRYANQVQACLPELTKLLQTKITPLMISTLLSAALSPMIQDGVRKLVGNWYIEHVIKVSQVRTAVHTNHF